MQRFSFPPINVKILQITPSPNGSKIVKKETNDIFALPSNADTLTEYLHYQKFNTGMIIFELNSVRNFKKD